MRVINLVELFKEKEKFINTEVKLQGWVRNHRKQKEIGFIDFYDGTVFITLQLVYNNEVINKEDKYYAGSAIEVIGKFVESNGSQDYELEVSNIILKGSSVENYPIQPKRHTREFLREVAYLRPRTPLFSAVFRVRSIVSKLIHDYFQNDGYVYLHSPIITANDGEGAGEMFQVTTFELENLKKLGKEEIDYSKDFFNKKTSLTVTGQLQSEAFALAFKKAYTFGPTFRAENSHTKTHAAEFWMIEPEIAFCDLEEIMKVEEDCLKYVIKNLLEQAPLEMEFFDKFVSNGLIEKLTNMLNTDVNKLTHKEAVDILLNCGVEFDNKLSYVDDLATEHEKYLTEVHFKSGVFITNWPKDIKAFYMRLNDDNETVAAVDFLVPGVGELMGGSQREERVDLLLSRMKELNIEEEGMEWYVNLRRFGGVEHAGFGIGFERLLIYLTGVDNIRDVIPFPRTPGNCEF